MAGGCVYDCAHPLWGGGGNCTVSEAGDPMCVCDAEYASRDSAGNASCVPRRVLVAAYLSLAAASLLAVALTAWNINQYRHLPVRVQSQRKTAIRLRALVCTRCDVRKRLVLRTNYIVKGIPPMICKCFPIPKQWRGDDPPQPVAERRG